MPLYEGHLRRVDEPPSGGGSSDGCLGCGFIIFIAFLFCSFIYGKFFLNHDTPESKNTVVYQDKDKKRNPPTKNQVPKTKSTYTINACGSITDNSTGLEWLIGEDRTMTWQEANRWVQELNVCNHNWRMPNITELKRLYDPGSTAGTGYYTNGRYFPAHLPSEFQAIGGGSWVWSDKSVTGFNAVAFNFNQGKAVTFWKDNPVYPTRVFAVH
jgi:hypothetical protein